MTSAIDDFSPERLHGHFFAPIATILERVAAERNVFICKYRQDLPEWQFLFTHPKGGTCGVQIMRAGTRDIVLYGSWNPKSRGTDPRNAYIAPGIRLPTSDATLEETLHNLIDSLIEHPLDQWNYTFSPAAATGHLPQASIDKLPLVRSRT